MQQQQYQQQQQYSGYQKNGSPEGEQYGFGMQFQMHSKQFYNQQHPPHNQQQQQQQHQQHNQQKQQQKQQQLYHDQIMQVWKTAEIILQILFFYKYYQ